MWPQQIIRRVNAISGNFTYPALRLRAAFSVPYTPNVLWSLGYRYVGSDDVNANDNVGVPDSQRLHSSNIELATRFHF